LPEKFTANLEEGISQAFLYVEGISREDFTKLVRLAVKAGVMMENEHHIKARVHYRLRDVLFGIGTRWARVGTLAKAEDVFELNANQIAERLESEGAIDGQKGHHPSITRPTDGCCRSCVRRISQA